MSEGTPPQLPWPVIVEQGVEQILQVADPVVEAQRRREQIGYEIRYDGRPTTSQQ